MTGHQLADKLVHPVKEIRDRAVDSLLFKLEGNLLTIADLCKDRALLDSLYKWLVEYGDQEFIEYVLAVLQQIAMDPEGRQTMDQIGILQQLISHPEFEHLNLPHDIAQYQDDIRSIDGEVRQLPKCENAFYYKKSVNCNTQEFDPIAEKSAQLYLHLQQAINDGSEDQLCLFENLFIVILYDYGSKRIISNNRFWMLFLEYCFNGSIQRRCRLLLELLVKQLIAEWHELFSLGSVYQRQSTQERGLSMVEGSFCLNNEHSDLKLQEYSHHHPQVAHNIFIYMAQQLGNLEQAVLGDTFSILSVLIPLLYVHTLIECHSQDQNDSDSLESGMCRFLQGYTRCLLDHFCVLINQSQVATALSGIICRLILQFTKDFDHALPAAIECLLEIDQIQLPFVLASKFASDCKYFEQLLYLLVHSQAHVRRQCSAAIKDSCVDKATVKDSNMLDIVLFLVQNDDFVLSDVSKFQQAFELNEVVLQKLESGNLQLQVCSVECLEELRSLFYNRKGTLLKGTVSSACDQLISDSTNYESFIQSLNCARLEVLVNCDQDQKQLSLKYLLRFFVTSPANESDEIVLQEICRYLIKLLGVCKKIPLSIAKQYLDGVLSLSKSPLNRWTSLLLLKLIESLVSLLSEDDGIALRKWLRNICDYCFEMLINFDLQSSEVDLLLGITICELAESLITKFELVDYSFGRQFLLRFIANFQWCSNSYPMQFSHIMGVQSQLLAKIVSSYVDDVLEGNTFDPLEKFVLQDGSIAWLQNLTQCQVESIETNAWLMLSDVVRLIPGLRCVLELQDNIVASGVSRLMVHESRNDTKRNICFLLVNFVKGVCKLQQQGNLTEFSQFGQKDFFQTVDQSGLMTNWPQMIAIGDVSLVYAQGLYNLVQCIYDVFSSSVRAEYDLQVIEAAQNVLDNFLRSVEDPHSSSLIRDYIPDYVQLVTIFIKSIHDKTTAVSQDFISSLLVFYFDSLLICLKSRRQCSIFTDFGKALIMLMDQNLPLIQDFSACMDLQSLSELIQAITSKSQLQHGESSLIVLIAHFMTVICMLSAAGKLRVDSCSSDLIESCLGLISQSSSLNILVNSSQLLSLIQQHGYAQDLVLNTSLTILRRLLQQAQSGYTNVSKENLFEAIGTCFGIIFEYKDVTIDSISSLFDLIIDAIRWCVGYSRDDKDSIQLQLFVDILLKTQRFILHNVVNAVCKTQFFQLADALQPVVLNFIHCPRKAKFKSQICSVSLNLYSQLVSILNLGAQKSQLFVIKLCDELDRLCALKQECIVQGVVQVLAESNIVCFKNCFKPLICVFENYPDDENVVVPCYRTLVRVCTDRVQKNSLLQCVHFQKSCTNVLKRNANCESTQALILLLRHLVQDNQRGISLVKRLNVTADLQSLNANIIVNDASQGSDIKDALSSLLLQLKDVKQ
ncbi:hypothetical protein MIR68_005052 [Amoeboaphelidium protococcarum]|nr:hypothetical protein MIR68_005052 [Amoeboaphelidium protococcarum]